MAIFYAYFTELFYFAFALSIFAFACSYYTTEKHEKA